LGGGDLGLEEVWKFSLRSLWEVGMVRFLGSA
jgi:hypothetical protein